MARSTSALSVTTASVSPSTSTSTVAPMTVGGGGVPAYRSTVTRTPPSVSSVPERNTTADTASTGGSSAGSASSWIRTWSMTHSSARSGRRSGPSSTSSSAGSAATVVVVDAVVEDPPVPSGAGVSADVVPEVHAVMATQATAVSSPDARRPRRMAGNVVAQAHRRSAVGPVPGVGHSLGD